MPRAQRERERKERRNRRKSSLHSLNVAISGNEEYTSLRG
jgi:hypothetical protein